MRQLFETFRFGRTWVESFRDWRTPGRIEKLFNTLQGEDLELFREVCASLPCPKQFMEENADEFGWDSRMIAAARIFTPRPLPSPVRYAPLSWHCFENCLRKAQEERIFYVEGLVIGPGGPNIHAWNSTDGVNVIDLNWASQHLNKYFGIIMNVEKHPECASLLGWIYHHAKEDRRKNR